MPRILGLEMLLFEIIVSGILELGMLTSKMLVLEILMVLVLLSAWEYTCNAFKTWKGEVLNERSK